VVLDHFEMALRGHAGLAEDVIAMAIDERTVLSRFRIAALAACAKRSPHDHTSVVDALKRRIVSHFKRVASQDQSAWLRRVDP
jgi:hypothetical protein